MYDLKLPQRDAETKAFREAFFEATWALTRGAVYTPCDSIASIVPYELLLSCLRPGVFS